VKLLRSTKPEPAKAQALCAEAVGSASACDPDALEVSVLFDGLRGQSPRTRILAYEGYVKRKPKGRYAVVLYEEAQQLRKTPGARKARAPDLHHRAERGPA